MANDVTGNPIYIDTAGIVSTAPLWIKGILYVPSAAADTVTLKYWREDSPRATMIDKTASGTDSNTLTSTGNFEAAEVVVTDIIHIFRSSTGNNTGRFAVTVRSSDDAIDVLPAGLTTESNKVYSWKTYASYPFAKILSQATDAKSEWLYFGNPGVKVPNLLVTALSTSSVLYVFV